MIRIFILVVCLFQIGIAHATTATSFAYEANSLKLAYSEISQAGTIRLFGCSRCDKSVFSFTTPPNILKQGNSVPFSFFLKDYWNAKYPTLFVDKNTAQVIQITY